MVGNGPYYVVLFAGVLIVIAAGQLLLRQMPSYLREVFSPGPARNIAQLVVIIFHLSMWGVVCLVTSVSLGWQLLSPSAVLQPTVQAVITRIGVLLVLVGLGYYLALRFASWIRESEEARQISADTRTALGGPGISSGRRSRGGAGPTAVPAKPDVRARGAGRSGLLGRRFR